jgi:hypothetical protein
LIIDKTSAGEIVSVRKEGEAEIIPCMFIIAIFTPNVKPAERMSKEIKATVPPPTIKPKINFA